MHVNGEYMKEKFMRQALIQAKKALAQDEVPIGAVIVKDGKIIARGYNQTEKTQNAIKHAEIIAIEKANRKLRSWRIDDAEIYVTVEPCAMCAGAIANARIKKVYFGASEPKSGCAESKYPILTDNGLNHVCVYQGGILKDECSTLLSGYFKTKRQKKKK